MSRTAQRHQAIAAKVQAQQMAKVATVALVEGRKVLSHHANFHEGNIALCDALDVFYGGGAKDGCPHSFDLIPLSYVPNVGADYDATKRVWVP